MSGGSGRIARCEALVKTGSVPPVDAYWMGVVAAWRAAIDAADGDGAELEAMGARLEKMGPVLDARYGKPTEWTAA